jgi:GLEYA domain-containing protein
LYAPLPGSAAYANLENARIHGLKNLDLSVLVGGAAPVATGVTPFVATIDGDEYKPIEVYGVKGPAGSSLGHSVLDHRGYLVPALKGTYVVTVPDADDAVFFWAGENATGGFSAGNAAIVKGYADGPPKRWELVVGEGEVGKPVAVRLLWANWAGRGVVELSVVDPEGKVVLGQRTGKNRQVLAGCEGNLAPVGKWPRWEDEVVGV